LQNHLFSLFIDNGNLLQDPVWLHHSLSLVCVYDNSYYLYVTANHEELHNIIFCQKQSKVNCTPYGSRNGGFVC